MDRRSGQLTLDREADAPALWRSGPAARTDHNRASDARASDADDEDVIPGIDDAFPWLRLTAQAGVVCVAIGCWLLIYRLVRLVV